MRWHRAIDPPGLQLNGIFGRSSNQEMLNGGEAPKAPAIDWVGSEGGPLAGLFDVETFSVECGLVKPEPEIYLRTAVSVDSDGWAHFGYVKMPD